jgi:hypothetical protein
MRKLTALGGLALAALIFPLCALGAMAEEEEKGKFQVHGQVRAGWDYTSNSLDFKDHDTGIDDDFDLFPYRVRLGVKGEFSDDVWANVELQHFGFFGNESVLKSGQDPFNQAFDTTFSSSSTNLYQGYLMLDQVGGSQWSFKLGRQEHTLGNELHMGDADWYNGLSFDGVRVMADWERFDLNLFHYIVAEQNAFVGVGGPDDVFDEEVTFTGATLNFAIGENGQALEPYLMFTRADDVFDTPGDAPPDTDLRLYTVGAQWGRAVESAEDVDAGKFDWSIEAAMQSGEFAQNGVANPVELDAKGNVIEGWFGFNWNHGGGGRSRVHVGAFMSSGDDPNDPPTDDIDEFISLFPDTRAHNRLGDLEFAETIGVGGFSGLGNLTDYNIGYEMWCKEARHGFMAALHHFETTEDIVFSPTQSETGLGDEFDLAYNYGYSDAVRFEAGIGYLMPGDVLDTSAELTYGPGEDADEVTRAWWRFDLRF